MICLKTTSTTGGESIKTKRSLALLLFMLCCAPGAHAQSGPPGSVAFHSNRSGNNNIYVMNPDGSAQVPVTSDTWNNQRADISPDGRHIVFASNRPVGGAHLEVFVMNADGTDIQQLTFTPATLPNTTPPVAVVNTWPRWSPDGEWIAYQSNVSNAFQIYLIHPDGSGLTQLTNSAVNQFPGWSPDGTRLLVRTDVGTQHDLYAIDVSGQSAPNRLTTTNGPLNQMASWSPDGTQIAFMSTRELGGYPSVFLMNADGSNPIDLTPKQDAGTGTWSSRAPAWSPNGQYIYFTGIRPKAPGEQIYVIRTDRTDLTDETRLTAAGANAEQTVRRVGPPSITSVTANPDVLWPPNSQSVRVSPTVVVSDDSDPSPACRITNVASNESIVGNGWQLAGPLTVDLLAQRFGGGSGRVYTVTVTCTNTSELSSTATVNVSVPHDRRK
jgi:Tol biopolymer transport system component